MDKAPREGDGERAHSKGRVLRERGHRGVAMANGGGKEKPRRTDTHESPG